MQASILGEKRSGLLSAKTQNDMDSPIEPSLSQISFLVGRVSFPYVYCFHSAPLTVLTISLLYPQLFLILFPSLPLCPFSRFRSSAASLPPKHISWLKTKPISTILFLLPLSARPEKQLTSFLSFLPFHSVRPVPFLTSLASEGCCSQAIQSVSQPASHKSQIKSQNSAHRSPDGVAASNPSGFCSFAFATESCSNEIRSRRGGGGGGD